MILNLKLGCMTETTDYKGREFTKFYVSKDSSRAPGWFVFGRNPEYAHSLIKLCARPIVKARSHPHYNGLIESGWKTKREAQTIADAMNLETKNPA